MAENEYLIESSDGTLKISVAENNVESSSTSMQLVGHGTPNYGTPQNTNFLHLLEHFASKDEPPHPILGQIWFKKIVDANDNIVPGKFELNVCSNISASNEVTWSKMSQVVTSTSGGYYENGDLYYDTTSKKLKVYDEETGGWIAVGPTDIIHTQHIFDSLLVNPNVTNITYDSFDMSVISGNITDTGVSSDNTVVGNGSLSLVKMTILAKEFKNGGSYQSISENKCCSWVYKFLVRSVKLTGSGTGDYNKVEIVGAPSFELIAQNPEEDEWNALVEINNEGDQQLMVHVTLPAHSNYITLGFDSEITRI